MADLTLLQQAGVNLPDISAQSIYHIIFYVVLAVFLTIVVCIGIYFMYIIMTYNKNVVLFKIVGGNPTQIAKDKARFQRIGMAGDYWLHTRKFKKILPRPKLEIMKNTYWYFEREDGEWINFRLENINERQKEAKSFFVDEDMRLQRLGIQKNLEKRFDKQGFWEKYGHVVMYAVTFLILTICLIIIFNKINDLVKALPALANALKDVALVLKDIQVHTTSGAIPVNGSMVLG